MADADTQVPTVANIDHDCHYVSNLDHSWWQHMTFSSDYQPGMLVVSCEVQIEGKTAVFTPSC